LTAKAAGSVIPPRNAFVKHLDVGAMEMVVAREDANQGGNAGGPLRPKGPKKNDFDRAFVGRTTEGHGKKKFCCTEGGTLTELLARGNCLGQKKKGSGPTFLTMLLRGGGRLWRRVTG